MLPEMIILQCAIFLCTYKFYKLSVFPSLSAILIASSYAFGYHRWPKKSWTSTAAAGGRRIENQGVLIAGGPSLPSPQSRVFLPFPLPPLLTPATQATSFFDFNI